MEVKVRNHIFGQVGLTTFKAEFAFTESLEDDRLVSDGIQVKRLGFHGLEDGDGAGDALLELGEDGFCVCDGDGVVVEDADGEELAGVGHVLDLVGETVMCQR